MAYGTINVDTLTSSTGVLATQNGMTGIAKAWVNYNAVTKAIISSFNVSSVTYTSTGIYIINFTTATIDANYSIATCISQGTTAGSSRCLGLYSTATDGSTGVNKTTSAVTVTAQTATLGGSGLTDQSFNGVVINGN